jgi:hypothetical protein
MSDETQATDTSPTETTEASATTEATSETVATEAVVEGSADDKSDASTVLGAASTEDGAGDADSKDEASDKSDAAEAVVPEAYDLKLTVDGQDGKPAEVAIDTALLDVATPTFKELGLTNEQAQKVAGLVPKVQERLLQQQNDTFAETRTAWAKQAAEDPEIGGKNWKSTQNLAAKALDHFVGPAVTKDAKGNEVKNDFRQLLDDTGLGNHPAMIRFCRKVGEGLAEDGTLARGSEGPRQKVDRLAALYPDDVKKAS